MKAKDVFINCPFDVSYKPIFDALVFAIYDLGFRARSALEVDDSSQNRLDKILNIIEECRYGVHDLSLDAVTGTGLPRFNMSLELGLYLGCKRYGKPPQQKKAALILDKDPFRYRESTSDISGFDIHAHYGQPANAIIELRDWLSNVSGVKRYQAARKWLTGTWASEATFPFCVRSYAGTRVN